MLRIYQLLLHFQNNLQKLIIQHLFLFIPQPAVNHKMLPTLSVWKDNRFKLQEWNGLGASQLARHGRSWSEKSRAATTAVLAW